MKTTAVSDKVTAPMHAGVLQRDRPMFLRQLCTDEYRPLPYTESDRRVLRRVDSALTDRARRSGIPIALLAEERIATAAGLRALNDEYGEEFFAVPRASELDEEKVAEAFAGDELVIDVQTHYMAPHSERLFPHEGLRDVYRQVMPGWWRDLDESHAWDLSYYLTNVYLRTETAVAVLTSLPGATDICPLFNDEMFATRTLVDNLAGAGRLLNHAVVRAESDTQRDLMAEMAERYDPVGWKVYTMGSVHEGGWSEPWYLDDERTGLSFLSTARELDKKLVCVHKGLSSIARNGEPRDVGPAAKAFPDLNFVIYHSAYEMPIGGAPGEGPYTEETADLGVNRLITTMRENGLAAGSNVYAELGTTWFCLIRRPVEAAHVLGKLIKQFGVDNVIWGTDGVWYGGGQPLIDAFRTFQIPERMCEEFGYQQLSPSDKEKILGLNAARVYHIDADAARRAARDDELAWCREAVAEYRTRQFPGVR